MHQHAAEPRPHRAHRHFAEPTASLLRLSAAVRLAVVGVLVAAIWAGVAWAWS
jgi:hypothetical protein